MGVRVAFIDDYEISRYVFSLLLSKIPGVSVVMVCNSGEEFLLKLPRTEVDIAVVDMVMPGMNGIETLAAAKQLSPGLKGICISSFDRDDMMLQLVDAGACAYLSKEANPSEFEKAIQRLLQDETYYPERLQQLIRRRL
jgi:DNA-binding NarL/FixJ family response regulator